MKNQILLLCVLLLVALTTACNHNGPAKPKRTVIAGHIKNLQVFPDDNKVVLEVLDFSRGLTKYTGTIDKNGSFKIYFDQYIAEDVRFTQDFRSSPIVDALIAHPGDSIHIELDYKSIGDVTFSGDAAETNTDLYEYTSRFYSTVDIPNLRTPLPNPENFKADCEKMKKELLKNEFEFVNDVHPDNEVKTWIKNSINLRYYILLGSFLNKYKSVSEQPSAPILLKDHISLNNKVEVPPLRDFINFGSDLDDIYSTKMLNAGSYNLLNFLMPLSDKDEVTKPANQRMKDKITQINESNNSPLIKQLLTARVFYATLAAHNPDGFDKNRGLLDSNIQSPFIKQPLLKLYSEVKKDLANPQTVANATLHNSVYSQQKTIIDTLISQNKGKVVYVDLWATWCGPCIASMPYAEKLKALYKGRNITFAAVCLGAKKADWKSIIADKKLTANQYYCEPAQIQSIVSGLKMNAYPHYVMITKTGEIIANGNDFRPDDPLTLRTIDKLLN